MDFFSEVYKAPNFQLAVALGQVPGWRIFRKFGANSDVDSGTEEIWPVGTPRVLPTATGVATVVSDDAADQDNTGTGARHIMVEGLDADGYEIGEEVHLTGLTPVLTTKSFSRVHRAYNLLSGTSDVNVGNISISVDSKLQAYIAAGTGQTLQTQYTVPVDKTLVITSYQVTAGRVANADVEVWSQIMYPPYTLHGVLHEDTWRTLSALQVYEGAITTSQELYVIPASSEIRQRVISTATNVQVTGTYSGYLVDTDTLTVNRVDS